MTANNPPTFSDGLNNQFVNEGATAQYTLPSITDPENDACSIAITTMPNWVSFNYATNVFTFNPPTSTANTYPVLFNLNDPSHSVSQ